MTNKKSKSNASSAASTSNMESSKAKLERLLAVREGRRRYASKLGQELTEILHSHLEAKDYERQDVIR